MPQDFSLLDIRATFIHMQVRAADIRRGDLHKHISGFLNAGIRNLHDSHIAGALVDKRFHPRTPFSRSRPGQEGGPDGSPVLRLATHRGDCP